jgi:hypothetical protein
MLVLVIGMLFPYPYPEKTVADAKNPMWGNFSVKSHSKTVIMNPWLVIRKPFSQLAHEGRIGVDMDNSHRDRQLILRSFQAAGDAPSIELLRLIPETIVGILNDPLASTRDKIRATECIMTMQKIQLAAVATVSSIKSRRDRRHAEPERRVIDWSSLDNECDTPPRLPKL